MSPKPLQERCGAENLYFGAVAGSETKGSYPLTVLSFSEIPLTELVFR